MQVSKSKGVRLVNVSKIYQGYGTDDEVRAVDDVSLTVEPGEFITLLGPSGCGKTTALRIIAGFELASFGDVYIGDRKVNDLTPDRRNTAMVFQSYALFPHLNVYDNIAYGLKIAKLPKDEVTQKVKDILDMVGLEGLENRSPSQISGGQQQRVALARALVMEPDLLLFDEPLSNLDAKLRIYMRNEIKKIQQKVGITAIYVTHDQAEAMSLSDRIIIMNAGKIAQMGTPREIYYTPNSRFVAEFIGNANFIDSEILEKVGDDSYLVEVEGTKMEVKSSVEMDIGEKCTLVLRPEAINIDTSQGILSGEITRSTFMGHTQEYDVKIDTNNGLEIFIEDSNPQGRKVYQVGDKVKLDFLPVNLHIVK